MFHVPEKHRITSGEYASDESYGNNGHFTFRISIIKDIYAYIVASDGSGWEHVSVSLRTKKFPVNRTPIWQEMCIIKDIFWDEEDTVIQFHPPHSEYINNHLYCLHLWRKVNYEFPLPDSIFVGKK